MQQFTLSFTLLALTLLTSSICSAAPQATPPVPDFTKGDPIGERHDWNLGPTGARGWMWGWKFQTTNARQIYITSVDKGSPADGLLEVGDVILGIGKQPFAQDARHAFGNAIATAEANEGKLTLIRWRKEETSSITIQLPALGGYRDSAPFDCPKSEAILTAGCKHVARLLLRKLPSAQRQSWVKKGGYTQYSEPEITGAVDSLALLATGKEEYSELVEQYALSFAPKDLKLDMSPNTGMASWGWGYINLFLCEYYLATEDDRVLPAINQYATAIAQGQSFIGSWGHTMAWPALNQGKLHGSLGGYGALNSAGLICHLSLVLAEKCGVKNPEIEQAISKANQFVGFYTDKGAIPYGDHFPNWGSHDDNGKNSMAAVLFDLQGMSREAQFFNRMTVASYGERENGHTGNYFSFLWGPLGAQRAGSDATAAFLKPQRWFYELNRSWNGSFPYQGKADAGRGEHSYSGWDSTGSFMLTYALPLKKLYITGKGTSNNNTLTGSELDAVIADGVGFSIWDKGHAHYEKKDAPKLLHDLKSWSPAVRFRAAKALAQKTEKHKFVAPLLAMLDNNDLQARYGACQGLGALGNISSSAVPALQETLTADDTWLRAQAASALTDIGSAAAPAIPSLLKLAATTDDSDPLQITQRFLAFGLFDAAGTYGQPGLLSKSLQDVDRDTLYKAVEQILANPDGRSRGTLNSVYSRLSFEELQPLLPAIIKAIEEPSPSGVMFSNQIRLAGIKMLAKHNIREGMGLCIQIMEIEKWGKKKRIGQSLDILTSYGGAAKPILPQLEKLEQDLLAHPEAKMLNPQILQLQQLMNNIKDAKESKELRSINT